jgi:aryl-alcohol dehydrogenase-like predicted oxidoreductase
MKMIDSKVNGRRVVLGTAQLGMAYGIANKTGKPDQITANEIVKAAWENGIREFDTAQGYKNSESVLGIALKAIAGAERAAIVTKLGPGANLEDKRATRRSLMESMNRLGCERLSGVMLHDEIMLDRWDRGVGAVMAEMVDEGITESLGVSVYSPERALQAIDTDQVTLIQIPTNIFDRRFEDAGVFDAAEKKRKTLYIRSIFLQGLILMAGHDLPPGMRYAAPMIEQVAELSTRFGRSPMEIALAFAKTAYPRTKLIVGAETPEQIRQNAAVAGNTMSGDQIETIKQTFRHVPLNVLNPSRWPV